MPKQLPLQSLNYVCNKVYLLSDFYFLFGTSTGVLLKESDPLILRTVYFLFYVMGMSRTIVLS